MLNRLAKRFSSASCKSVQCHLIVKQMFDFYHVLSQLLHNTIMVNVVATPFDSEDA